jgi:hypothetical protein
MMPPTSIDGTDITGATIDGSDVSEITVDGQTVFTAEATPQAGLLHQWDWSNVSATTSTVPDLVGSADLTGSFTGFDTINGVTAGNFQNDKVETSAITNFTNGRVIYVVVELDDLNDGTIWSNDDGPINYLAERAGDNFAFNRTGNSADNLTIAATLNPTIISVELNSTDIMRVNGTQVSKSYSANGMTGLYIGERWLNDGFRHRMSVGECLMYQTGGATFSDVEDYLKNKWGITF